METVEHITTSVGFFLGVGAYFLSSNCCCFTLWYWVWQDFLYNLPLFCKKKKKPQKEVYPNLFIDFVQGWIKQK